MFSLFLHSEKDVFSRYNEIMEPNLHKPVGAKTNQQKPPLGLGVGEIQ